jgi:hypothetical protein
MPEEMIETDALGAVLNCAADALPFILEPETFPVFYAWMCRRGRVKPDYTAEKMRSDVITINAALGWWVPRA